jgi:lipoprotein-anchoring transpeptidase ErfK/SrfK
VYAKLFRGNGAFKLRYPSAGKKGKHVEFDWSRQVLVLARRGRPYRIYHSSSGKASTPTVMGKFSFYLKTPGTNSHGMVDSSYFIGGYAIHGYAEVPNYPASHGCLRVPIPNARQIYDWVQIGDPIFVYQ